MEASGRNTAFMMARPRAVAAGFPKAIHATYVPP